MVNDKNVNLGGELEDQDEELTHDGSTRARNRTVMLTPEITGQVRAMLAEEIDKATPAAEASQGQKGFRASTAVAGSSYVPAGGTPRGRPVEPASSGSIINPVQDPARSQREPRPQPAAAKLTPVVGFLVSFDSNPNGDVYELRSGRWIVSSEQTTAGNFIIIDDQTVSPLHAIIRVSSAGEIQVLDQLSEFGTGITRPDGEEEEELTGAMSSIAHGDVLRFGERKFHVCLISKGSE